MDVDDDILHLRIVDSALCLRAPGVDRGVDENNYSELVERTSA